MLVEGGKPDEILSCRHSTSQRHCTELDDVSILGARWTFNEGIHTLQHTEVSGRVPGVIRWTRNVDTLVRSALVEAHPLVPTVNLLLNTFVDVRTRVSIRIEPVSRGAGAAVTPLCVGAVVLTDRRAEVTLVTISTRLTRTSRCKSLGAVAAVSTLCVDTSLVVVTSVLSGAALVHIFTLPVCCACVARATVLYTLVTSLYVDALLAIATAVTSLVALVDVSAAPAVDESESRWTRTDVAAVSVVT